MNLTEYPDLDVIADTMSDAGATEIVYTAVRRSPRKGAQARLVGHEWRCHRCNEIVHTELRMNIDEELSASEERFRRIAQKVRDHRQVHDDQDEAAYNVARDEAAREEREEPNEFARGDDDADEE